MCCVASIDDAGISVHTTQINRHKGLQEHSVSGPARACLADLRAVVQLKVDQARAGAGYLGNALPCDLVAPQQLQGRETTADCSSNITSYLNKAWSPLWVMKFWGMRRLAAHARYCCTIWGGFSSLYPTAVKHPSCLHNLFVWKSND